MTQLYDSDCEFLTSHFLFQFQLHSGKGCYTAAEAVSRLRGQGTIVAVCKEQSLQACDEKVENKCDTSSEAFKVQRGGRVCPSMTGMVLFPTGEKLREIQHMC